MNVKAARDVLDYKGKRWTEFVEADIKAPNFDPAKIVREVVETGNFKADASKMEPPLLDTEAVSKLASSFSNGRKFRWNTRGITRMLACEHLPIGLQYVIYDRRRESDMRFSDMWVETDADLMQKMETN